MRSLWLLALVAILYSGCARPAPKVWTDVPTSEALVRRFDIAAERYRTLDTEAKVSLSSRGKFFSTNQFLLVERPSRLRADVLTGFGQLIMQLATDGESVTAFLNHTVPGTFYSGAATRDNLARFVKIPLEVTDLVAVLLHAPPRISWRTARVEPVDDSSLLLFLSNDQHRQEVRFDSLLRVTSCRYFRGESLVLMVEYDDFSDSQDFPWRLKMTVPAQQTVVSVTLKQPVLNTTIDARQFQLKAPEGVPVEQL